MEPSVIDDTDYLLGSQEIGKVHHMWGSGLACFSEVESLVIWLLPFVCGDNTFICISQLLIERIIAFRGD